MARRTSIPNPHEGLDLTVEKRCGACKEVLLLSAFYKEKGGVAGRQYECKPCTRKRDATRRFGITIEELVEEQGSEICPICQISHVFHIDHDHKTGNVRGALCMRCNQVLGYIENREWLARAIQYLDHPPHKVS